MATNSTPRLKVYRLNEGYSQAHDNDVQSMVNDEMLPIVGKSQNPFNAETMVGVRTRQDGRIVAEAAKWSIVAIDVELAPGGYVQAKEPVCCEGWVLGKGNMEVCVFRAKSGATTASNSISLHADRSPYAAPSDNATGEWVPLDRKFWDYTVETRKTYIGTAGEAPTLPTLSTTLNPEYFSQFDQTISFEDNNGTITPSFYNGWLDSLSFSSSNGEVHEMDWITFRVGRMLLDGTEQGMPFANAGYSQFIPITETQSGVYSGKILVRYRKYCEMGTTLPPGNSVFSGVSCNAFNPGSVERYRVPFGDVYNGNKNGRCLHVKNENNGEYLGVTRVIEEQGQALDLSRQSFYEGNYLYKRRIYPLRVKVLKASGDTDQDFKQDVELVNGQARVPCEMSWFMDDVMKPVVFERLLVDAGTPDQRKIFRQLSRKQVTVMYQSASGNDHYLVNLNSVYYGNSQMPTELFLVYNYVDDSLGNNVFDFDYDYMTSDESGNYNPPTISYGSKSGTIGYGYANDGHLATDDPTNDSALSVGGLDGCVYLKRSILAVDPDAGRDGTIDLQLAKVPGTSVSFSLDSPSFGIDPDGKADVEKHRLTDGIASIVVEERHPLAVFVDGELVCEFITNGTESNRMIGGETGFTVSYVSSTKTVTISHPEGKTDGIVEVMASYYEKHQISFTASSSANPYCIGYRVMCHEKMKSAMMFVSSFPNWVKGHVNNDLDVFVGNKLYSGTEVSGGNLREYHNIYPQYVKDGWYAMYQDGAVEFNEAQEELNYFDILNYGGDTVASLLGSNSGSTGGSVVWGEVAAPGWKNPDYWADAKKLALAIRKVKCNVARYDGIYSVMRGRMSNYSNRNGVYRYALIDDEDNRGFFGNRLVGREDSNTRRVLESGRDELPKLIRGISSNDEGYGLEELHDIVLGNNQIATVNTGNDRVTMFTVPANSHVVIGFGSNPTDAEVVATSADSGYYMPANSGNVRLHMKVSDGVLKMGLEKNPGTVNANFSHESVFGVDDGDVDWVQFPDNQDVYLGELVEDDYKCPDIESVQASCITIDGRQMKYWIGEEKPSGPLQSVPEGGLVPYPEDGSSMLRRFLYHDGSVVWVYDVCFEVVSYRYDDNGSLACVEVVAYRYSTD